MNKLNWCSKHLIFLRIIRIPVGRKKIKDASFFLIYLLSSTIFLFLFYFSLLVASFAGADEEQENSVDSKPENQTETADRDKRQGYVAPGLPQG